MDSTAFNLATRKPRRVSVTVADNAYKQLLAVSDEQGRSVSNLCAYLLERGLESFVANAGHGHVPPRDAQGLR